MDALKFNKIAAAILCGGLLILGFGKLGDFLVHPNTSVNNAYPIKVAENAAEAIKEVTVTVIEPILAMLSGADIEAGQKIAKKCSACHGFESGEANKVGPNLYDIVGREQGKADFAYSKVFLAMSGQWSYEELNKFLYKPKEYAKGTKMNYAGLTKTNDRANLIAWLRTKSNKPVPLSGQ
ncbi:MAG: cytochrome c family protein [Proteobacteria bacterium]|nr:cytochrome c family protein [Pseudomonadota bacterium]MDA1135022.1 cytochrome c family protein [Pseudomonadota bacterium]